MKILFQTRSDFMKNPAGDSVQMISTGQALKDLGVEVQISTVPNIDLSPYDLVHIFNMTRIKESYLFFLNAQKQKKMTILSPIYWPPNAYLKREGARSHALASWFETPGLSSLEAGACGTVVISTDQGSPKEYFQDMALYVHPMDDISLRTALEQALNASSQPLMQHIHKHYPWSNVAGITLEAYRNVLK